jgi:hypothetical protein
MFYGWPLFDRANILAFLRDFKYDLYVYFASFLLSML